MTDASEVSYLGTIKYLRGTYASVEPLVESNPSGTEWTGSVTKARFPSRGLVHWYDPPRTIQEGSLWQFRVEEIPEEERGARWEHFRLIDPVEPYEVIDVRAWAPIGELQATITSVG